MVKERWIKSRQKYLSSQGKIFSLFFLSLAIVLAIFAAIVGSKCGLVLAISAGVGIVLARFIAFVAGLVVQLIATAVWPPERTQPLTTSIEISQSLCPISTSTPLPGVPRFFLHS